VLSQVDEKTRYTFDQTCRVTAIEEAARLGVHRDGALVSINFLPNAVYEPANCIRATLRAAERARFPLSSIMFEVTEAEEVRDTDHLSRIIASYKEMGFTVAIDDFGAGFAGLSLLSDFRPDLVKLDMKLVRGSTSTPGGGRSAGAWLASAPTSASASSQRGSRRTANSPLCATSASRSSRATCSRSLNSERSTGLVFLDHAEAPLCPATLMVPRTPSQTSRGASWCVE
jgi:hypothetical protein